MLSPCISLHKQAIAQHLHSSSTCILTAYTLWILVCRKFDFFPKGTAGADGWMSLYFKFADQFSDNQQIGFGFKLHVINFQFPSQTLTKGVWMELLDSCCACSVAFWSHCCAVCATMFSSLLNSGKPDQYSLLLSDVCTVLLGTLARCWCCDGAVSHKHSFKCRLRCLQLL